MSKKIKTLLFTLAFSFFLGKHAYAATYSVSPGDSLYKLGNLFNIPVSTIMTNNKLSSSTIYVDQKLNILSSCYTIKSGDTLYSISKKFQVPIANIQKINNISNDTIFAGQNIYLPAGLDTVSSAYSASDISLLSRLINAEAGGEPYEAQVAVGAVVMNRVKSADFPNSISGVINEQINGYYQFTPVLNGYINNPASQSSINAAYAAINGNDPTNGALFYFDNSTTNSWLWSLPISIEIDKMVFSY
jgi:spore germination cell wall hydrolase CwlJ-like protein